jgi:hypothetical protein
MPIISALRRLRQEDHEFKTSLGYTVRPCLYTLPLPPTPKKKKLRKEGDTC